MTATASTPAASTPKAGVALAVRNLSVSYGNVVAVHDATFTVAEGAACPRTFRIDAPFGLLVAGGLRRGGQPFLRMG